MIQSISKTYYQTSDNAEFEVAADAAAHQAKLDLIPTVDAYVAEAGGESDRNHTRLKNALLDFAAWQARRATA